MLRFRQFISLVALILNMTCAPFGFEFYPNPKVAEVLYEGDSTRWMNWIAVLSGAQPIQTAEGEVVIQTRSSFIMFEPDQTPNAFAYLQDELRAMGFNEDREYKIHTYDYPYGRVRIGACWKKHMRPGGLTH